MDDDEKMQLSHKMLKEIEQKLDRINIKVENIKMMIDIKKDQIGFLPEDGQRIL